MAAKGGQVPDVKLGKTKISEFDQFFTDAKDPLSTLVNWNNQMDSDSTEFRKIGSDLRKASSAEAPPAIGDLNVEVNTQGQVSMAVTKDGGHITSFDKVTGQYVKTVEKKIKLVNSRLATMRKKPGFEGAKYEINDKNQVVIGGVSEETLKANEDEAFIVDTERSLLKLNNRKELLDLQLKGPVSLAEAVSGFLASLKTELEKKAKSIKITIVDNMPKLEGIPEDIEDLLPSLLSRAYKLFMNFIDLIKEITSQLPELMPKIETLISKAKELPGKAASSAKASGLTGMEIPKAIRTVSRNVKAISSAPAIAKQLGDTVKSTSLQLADAVTGNKADANS